MIYAVYYISGDTSLPDGHFSPESDLPSTSGTVRYIRYYYSAAIAMKILKCLT